MRGLILLVVLAVGCRSHQPLMGKVESKREILIERMDSVDPGLQAEQTISKEQLDTLKPGQVITRVDTVLKYKVRYFKEPSGDLKIFLEEKDKVITGLRTKITDMSATKEYVPVEVIKEKIPFKVWVFIALLVIACFSLLWWVVSFYMPSRR